MRLPLAIHTARQGYAWLNQGQQDYSLLERFRKAIGKMPDIDCGEPLSCGALNFDEWVVVFRFMVEKGGDFRGRDCLYLALTYFQRSVASSVNIARLLEVSELSAPLREPPSTIDYGAGDSLPCQVDHGLDPSDAWKLVEFVTAGSAFQQPFEGVLRLQQVEGKDCMVSFSSSVVCTVDTQPPQVSEDVYPESGSEQVQNVNVWQLWQDRVGWAAVVVAFFLIAWIFDMRKEEKQLQTPAHTTFERNQHP
jgi:hypothetical protein